jgi:hypothetical protein
MTESARAPACPPWAYVALYAAAATWITFAGIHREHNSDSLIESLASLYAWTPFFWQQDRVGLLIPWLAQVCPDPVMNTVLQTGLTVFIGLCVPLLLVELVSPHPIARAAATVANAAMIALAPDLIRRNLLFECYYPLAMCLGCLGLLVLGRGPGWPRWWRVLVAAGLLGLAHWVYVGVPLWLGPLALVRGWMQPGEPWPRSAWRALLRPALHPRTVIGCVLIVAAFGAGFTLMLHVQHTDPAVLIPTPRDGVEPAEWPAAWATFVEHLAELPGMSAWSFTLLAGAVIGIGACLLTRRWPAYPVFAAAVVLLVPAAAEFLYLSTRYWIQQNLYHPRYLLGTLESLQTLLAVVAAAPLAGWAARGCNPRIVFGVAALVLFATAAYHYGWPSWERPREDLENVTRPPWADKHGIEDVDAYLLRADVDAIGGEYWTVWPTVYYVNMKRRERGESRLLFGVSDRGRVLIDQRWDPPPKRGLHVAVLKSPQERQWLSTYAPVCSLTKPVWIRDCGPFEIYVTYPLDARP